MSENSAQESMLIPEWLPSCLAENGNLSFSKPCLWGLEGKDIASTGLPLLGIVSGTWILLKRSARSAHATLRPTAGWPLHDNLPSLPGNFVTRGEQDKLIDRIRPGAAVAISAAISGMGGVGKTTLALGTATALKHSFAGVWLIPAATSEALIGALSGLLGALGLHGCGNGAEDAKSALRAVVADGKPWLLIYDNAEDQNLLTPFLPPPGGAVSVLLTTRRSDWDSCEAERRSRWRGPNSPAPDMSAAVADTHPRVARTVSPHGQGLGKNRRQRRSMAPPRPHQARHEAPSKGMTSRT